MAEQFVSSYAGEPWFEPRARAVKIGYTRGCPEKRLATLQTGCPETLYLTGDMDGCPELEVLLHERWACNHIRGEWFSIDGNGIEEFLKDYDGTLIFCVPSMWPQIWEQCAA